MSFFALLFVILFVLAVLIIVPAIINQFKHDKLLSDAMRIVEESEQRQYTDLYLQKVEAQRMIEAAKDTAEFKQRYRSDRKFKSNVDTILGHDLNV